MSAGHPHYFFIILGEDSCGILTIIPSERVIIGAAKFSLTITVIILRISQGPNRIMVRISHCPNRIKVRISQCQ